MEEEKLWHNVGIMSFLNQLNYLQQSCLLRIVIDKCSKNLWWCYAVMLLCSIIIRRELSCIFSFSLFFSAECLNFGLNLQPGPRHGPRVCEIAPCVDNITFLTPPAAKGNPSRHSPLPCLQQRALGYEAISTASLMNCSVKLSKVGRLHCRVTFWAYMTQSQALQPVLQLPLH